MESFPTYKQIVEKEEAKIKQRHDYSIAKYINMHSEAQMEVVADELKQQLDKGNKYPSTKVFEIPYTIEDANFKIDFSMYKGKWSFDFNIKSINDNIKTIKLKPQAIKYIKENTDLGLKESAFYYDMYIK